MAKITKNEQENLVENYTKKPAYSNSRLGVHIDDTPHPKLSFDGMTIVGNLSKENASKLAEFMAYEPRVRLWDTLQTKFKAKALEERVYIDYDRIRADAWDRRNMRVEFNPNKLEHEDMVWLKKHFIDVMEDDGFTRIDLAFDFEDDLSDYYAMSDKALKKTVFYGTSGIAETKYFGSRDSDRFIRIYNKKKERKDNADVEVMSEHLWRVEIELKRHMVDMWNGCFDDLHILKPDYTTIEKATERHTIMALLFDENEWGKLERRRKYKMRKLMTEISPIDLTELMKSTLKANEKQLQKQIDFWQREFRFWK